MNRHSFRWTGLAFGAFFLAVAGNWAVWQGELLSTREMGYILSTLLIVAGIAGVLLTLRSPSTAPAPAPVEEAAPVDNEPIPVNEQTLEENS